MSTRPLTRADMELLEFARATWKFMGARDTAILERFGTSSARYAQRLHHLVEQPAAVAYDAQVVRQVRDLRDARSAVRAGHGGGW